jgi:acyl-CoA synthetase (NDP forming)
MRWESPDSSEPSNDERIARRDADERAKAAEKALEELRKRPRPIPRRHSPRPKKDGAAESRSEGRGQIRRSEVKAALSAAGINASVLDLAVNAPEFAALKVDDDGVVTGLEAAVGVQDGPQGPVRNDGTGRELGWWDSRRCSI